MGNCKRTSWVRTARSPCHWSPDITAGLIDVANFCAGEVTANQVIAANSGHIR
jgi:hypothetical protein